MVLFNNNLKVFDKTVYFILNVDIKLFMMAVSLSVTHSVVAILLSEFWSAAVRVSLEEGVPNKNTVNFSFYKVKLIQLFQEYITVAGNST